MGQNCLHRDNEDVSLSNEAYIWKHLRSRTNKKTTPITLLSKNSKLSIQTPEIQNPLSLDCSFNEKSLTTPRDIHIEIQNSGNNVSSMKDTDSPICPTTSTGTGLIYSKSNATILTSLKNDFNSDCRTIPYFFETPPFLDTYSTFSHPCSTPKSLSIGKPNLSYSPASDENKVVANVENSSERNKKVEFKSSSSSGLLQLDGKKSENVEHIKKNNELINDELLKRTHDILPELENKNMKKKKIKSNHICSKSKVLSRENSLVNMNVCNFKTYKQSIYQLLKKCKEMQRQPGEEMRELKDLKSNEFKEINNIIESISELASIQQKQNCEIHKLSKQLQEIKFQQDKLTKLTETLKKMCQSQRVENMQQKFDDWQKQDREEDNQLTEIKPPELALRIENIYIKYLERFYKQSESLQDAGN